MTLSMVKQSSLDPWWPERLQAKCLLALAYLPFITNLSLPQFDDNQGNDYLQ